MASIEEHLQQWKHNRDFLEDIAPNFPDWMVTASLYLAIHAIEALLTADKAKSRSRHQDRLQILMSEKRYENIYRHFRSLYDLCHVTRYSATPSKWVRAEQIEKHVIKSLVYPIENSVRKLLVAAKSPLFMPDVPSIKLRTTGTADHAKEPADS